MQRCQARSSARERRRQRLETQEKAPPAPKPPSQGAYSPGNGDYSPSGPVLVRRKPGQYAPGGSGPEHVRQLVLVQKERHRRNRSEGAPSEPLICS